MSHRFQFFLLHRQLRSQFTFAPLEFCNRLSLNAPRSVSNTYCMHEHNTTLSNRAVFLHTIEIELITHTFQFFFLVEDCICIRSRADRIRNRVYHSNHCSASKRDGMLEAQHAGTFRKSCTELMHLRIRFRGKIAYAIALHFLLHSSSSVIERGKMQHARGSARLHRCFFRSRSSRHTCPVFPDCKSNRFFMHRIHVSHLR